MVLSVVVLCCFGIRFYGLVGLIALYAYVCVDFKITFTHCMHICILTLRLLLQIG